MVIASRPSRTPPLKVRADTLIGSIAPLLVPFVLACSTSSRLNPPWVVVTKSDLATVSLDTSRIEAQAPGYRIHILSQFAEPAYRPKVGGPAYDLGELSLDIDCNGRRARNIDAVVFDSLRRPVHRETYPPVWKDFTQNDLGQALLTNLCRVLSHFRPIHDARILT